MVNWLIFCSFVFSMAMTLLGVMVDMSYHMTYQPQIEKWQQSQQEALAPFMELEQKYLTHPIFRPRSQKQKDLTQLLREVQKGDLQQPLLDQDMKREILSLGSEWLEQKHKIKKVPAILQLFSQVEEYDHWIPDQSLPPQFASDLIVAGEIYLAFVFYNEPESIREALQKTRHLSVILLQTDDFNYKRAGLSLLDKENVFMEFLNSRFLKSRILWTPVSSDELKKYRKHMGQTANYLSHLSHPTLLKEVFLGDQNPLGFCSAAKVKQALIKWGKPYLQSRFIFEPGFYETVQTVDRVMAKARVECQLAPIKGDPNPHWARRLPYYRRLFGIKMILTAEKSVKVL